MPKVAQSPSLYGRFAAQMSSSARNGNTGVYALDNAPLHMDELREYFVAMPLNELAGVWVAAIVETHEREHTAGDLARALIVVANRLHNAHVANPKEFIMPDPISKFERQRREIDAATKKNLQQNMEHDTAQMEESHGFSVREGVPPPPKRATTSHPIYRELLGLEEGRFIVVKSSKIKPHTLIKLLGDVKKAGGPSLRRYTIANGDQVVIHDPPKELNQA